MDPIAAPTHDQGALPADGGSERDLAPSRKKYIRTYARDMEVVQRGGTPDLSPLGEHAGRAAPSASAALVPDAASPAAPSSPNPAPVPDAAPVLRRDAPVPAPSPSEAVVTTYEDGVRKAEERARGAVPASPAAVSWQAGEEDRQAVLERLRQKAEALGLPTEGAGEAVPVPQKSIPHPRVEGEILKPAPSALSVPFAMAAPETETPPAPPPPPEEPLLPLPRPAGLGTPSFDAESRESPPEPMPPPPAPPLPPSLMPRETRPAAREAPELSLTHTYTTDFSSRMQDTRASKAALIAAQSDARARAPLPAREGPAPRKSRRYVIIAVALILVGGGVVTAAYVRYAANTGPVALPWMPAAPINVDEREEVEGSGAALMSAFQGSVGHPLREGAVRLVVDPSATTTTVFNALELPAPGNLSRNILVDGSMAGVVTIGGTQSPFFILAVAAFGDTFAGMLQWESSMLRSLAPLYPAYPEADASLGVPETGATTALSVTPILAPPPPDQGFVDNVVANHDARVYRDSAGRSVLIYGYWNQGTLVIARDEAAFTAILERLASSRSR